MSEDRCVCVCMCKRIFWKTINLLENSRINDWSVFKVEIVLGHSLFSFMKWLAGSDSLDHWLLTVIISKLLISLQSRWVDCLCSNGSCNVHSLKTSKMWVIKYMCLLSEYTHIRLNLSKSACMAIVQWEWIA